MTEQAKDAIAADVAELMTRYSFDLEGYGLEQWIELWWHQYPRGWLAKAVIEALYQGRYKAVSVWQILELWQRRGRPLQHFSREFERMISGQSLQLLFSESPSRQTVLSVPDPLLIATHRNGARAMARNGHGIEAAPFQQTQFQRTPAVSPSAHPAPHSTDSALVFTRLQPPGLGPPIQPFQPSQQFQLTLPGEIRRATPHSPIQQFVPAPEASDMPDKLRAIAQSLLLKNAQMTADALEAARLPADYLLDDEPADQLIDQPTDQPLSDYSTQGLAAPSAEPEPPPLSEKTD